MGKVFFCSPILLITVLVTCALAQDKAVDCSSPTNSAVASLVKEGLQLEERQDFAGAIEASKKVLAVEPRNECALNTISGPYGVLRNFKEEIYWAKRAIEINPNFAKAYINLGNAEGSLGNIREAEAAFKKVQSIVQ